jgi:glutathione S-transferase
LVNSWHGIRVGKYRKAAGVKYPTAYVSEADASKSIEKYQFNCAQRAHANYLESYPNFLVTMMVAGFANAKVAAGLGGVFLVGRVLYALGYVRPIRDAGKGRLNGSVQYVGLIGNLGLGAWAIYKMLL